MFHVEQLIYGLLLAIPGPIVMFHVEQFVHDPSLQPECSTWNNSSMTGPLGRPWAGKMFHVEQFDLRVAAAIPGPNRNVPRGTFSVRALRPMLQATGNPVRRLGTNRKL
jgi:hypothetical protein